jgi:hypothetical protein
MLYRNLKQDGVEGVSIAGHSEEDSENLLERAIDPQVNDSDRFSDIKLNSSYAVVSPATLYTQNILFYVYFAT